MKKFLWIIALTLFFGGLFFATSTLAANFPEKSITLHIPYSAGGSTDISARMLASAAEKILGKPITVVNTSGGGGTVMLSLLKNKKPDGYTLGVIPTSAITRTPHLLDVEYDPFKDFTFIMKYGLYSMFLVVKGDSPYQSFSDFVEAARKNPGKISFATPGAMEAGALALKYVSDKEKIDMNMIPYPGIEGMVALMGDHVDAYSGAGGVETHMSEVRAGEYRVLATYTSVRNPALPDVPTLKDLGYDFAINSGIGIGGPAGIPADRLKTLEEAFIKATEADEFQEVTKRLIMPTILLNHIQFRESLENDSVVLGEILKSIGFKKN